MRVLAISNQKGGCGKTTTAINLSAALAALGERTLLVDLDPQAHATFGLGFRGPLPNGSTYNLLTEKPQQRIHDLEHILIPVAERLDLAPSHLLLSTIEQELTQKEESVSKLHEALDRLSFPYDYAVLDCPPNLGFLTFNALRASQTVLVPIELSSFSLMGVDKLLSMIELLRTKLSHTPRVFALPTLVDLRTRFGRHMMDELREVFGSHILTTVIRQTVAVKESQAKGVPLVQYNPKSKGAVDYLMLAQELLQKTSSEPDALEFLTSPTVGPSAAFWDFTVKADGAQKVYVVGDFNNWAVSEESLLWPKEGGVWKKRIRLEPGRYRYKFLIDGQWATDPANQRIEPNPYGGVDSILEIG